MATDRQFQKNSMYLETPEDGAVKNFDDDGRIKRTGTWVTASAHIITAVIGSGVLSLAWAIAQMGWVAGPAVLFAFSFITYFTSTLLADSYRSPDPVHGKRNYTYSDVVKSTLGGKRFQLCGLAQYINLVGVTIGYTITASISMVAVKRSNCFHKHGHAIMSFAYSSIGLGLSIAKLTGGGHHVRTSLTGVQVGVDVSGSEKVWRTFQAIGDIAFAYAYSNVLIEIQDTLKSSPPENKVMKRASLIGIMTTTIFYVLCGCLGYAAFGNDAPGNFLTGFGFYEPFWLIDFANVCIAVHLVGAYQVFCQPIFGFVEKWSRERWSESQFVNGEYGFNIPFCGTYNINFFRVVWRTAYVIVTAVIAMIFPFFNDFLGLIGSLSFWPLTVYFPIEMYIKQSKMQKFTFTWTWMKILSWACLIVSIISAAGSIQGLAQALKKYQPFKAQQ
ncbi:hypothetical protein L6164_024077 [Bauhinia variegata]|uniref:Uncharacterized protein n=1 Tax=Bauhinia variegata TaxID=167791 RepID=A0ACB9LWK6_BAUVA|nr:hypothetical protein L6164_024077 [Bauhinia variegata]